MPRDSEGGRIKESITNSGLQGRTVKELVDTLGLSESCVRRWIARLKKQQWLREDVIEKPSRGRPEKVFFDKRVK